MTWTQVFVGWFLLGLVLLLPFIIASWIGSVRWEKRKKREAWLARVEDVQGTTGVVPVPCWCDRGIVTVHRSLADKGETRTCGRRNCTRANYYEKVDA